MSEVSTRIWLEERLWNEVTSRAVHERTTVRELLPQLVSQSLAGTVPAAPAGHRHDVSAGGRASAESPAAEPGPPVVTLSDVYRCDVCGAEVRLGGLSMHLGKHKKEREASEA